MKSILPFVLKTALILNLSTVALGQAEIQDLSLDEKVGQLLFIGFQGTEISESLEKHFQTIRPAGVLLFRRNIENPLQIAAMNAQLQRISKEITGVPLLLAIDQEGGQVVRVPSQPPLPSPRAVGRSRNPKLAYEFGYETGKLLNGLGFNMNLAPVLDLGSESQFDFLANRTLGSNPKLISVLGRKFSEGLLAAGVLPTAKHFPGATPSNGDPHLGVITDLSDRKMIASRLRPFQNFSQLFPTAMMMSHIRYPNIDPRNVPVGFSKMMMTEILRRDANYAGLAITDDLMMDGAKVFGSLEEAALQAVLAGNNLIMVSWSTHDQKKVQSHLLASVKNGRLPLSVLNERVERVLKVKRVLGQDASKRSPRWTSGGLARLESRLLEKNIANDFRFLRGKSLKDVGGSIYVLEGDLNYMSQIERHFPGEVRRVSLSQVFSLKLKTNDLLIAFNNNRRRQKSLAQFPQRLKSQTLVVNLMAPGLSEKNYWGVLNPYFSHPKLGWEIGSYLKKWASGRWSPEPIAVRLSNDQFHAESSSTRYHQVPKPSALLQPSTIR